MLVQFVGGDINQPIVSGCFHHSSKRPPVENEGELVFQRRHGDTLSHIRLTNDRGIVIQQGVREGDDGSNGTSDDKAKASIRLAADGTVAIFLHQT